LSCTVLNSSRIMVAFTHAPLQAMEFIYVKNTFLDEVPITDESMRPRSRSCPPICSRSICAPKELVLTEPPRVRNQEIDAEEDMDFSTSWSAQSCNSGSKPFMIDVLLPVDPNEAASTSSTAEPVAEKTDQGKKTRPCKAKRNRYKKLVHKLQTEISDNPEVFRMDQIDFPPSLQANESQRLKLIDRMERYQNRVLTSHGG